MLHVNVLHATCVVPVRTARGTIHREFLSMRATASVVARRLSTLLHSASWDAAVHRWAATHAHVGKFGEHTYWNDNYISGRAANEWFLEAHAAATSACDALDAHGRNTGSAPRLLHLGCGISSLGAAMCDELSSRHGLQAKVMNVDYCAAAIDSAALAGAGDARQQWRVWDATDASGPPSLSEVDAPYDLLLDKGTLDALQFAGPSPLVAYFSSLRRCLLAESAGAQVSPLLVHFSQEAPEARGELLECAFPSHERWHVSCQEVAPSDDETAEADEPWRYFRYTVSQRS